MSDDGLDAQFKDILRRKNERDAKARAETKAWRDEAQQQLTDFQKVRDGAIVPALEDVSAVARSNGQDGVRLKVHDGGERVEFYWEPPHPPNPTRLKFTWDSRKPAEV